MNDEEEIEETIALLAFYICKKGMNIGEEFLVISFQFIHPSIRLSVRSSIHQAVSTYSNAYPGERDDVSGQ